MHLSIYVSICCEVSICLFISVSVYGISPQDVVRSSLPQQPMSVNTVACSTVSACPASMRSKFERSHTDAVKPKRCQHKMRSTRSGQRRTQTNCAEERVFDPFFFAAGTRRRKPVEIKPVHEEINPEQNSQALLGHRTAAAGSATSKQQEANAGVFEGPGDISGLR